jgi:hypothetical protein
MREVNAVNNERAALKARRVADNLRDQVVAAYRKVGLLKLVPDATGLGYDMVRRVLGDAGVLPALHHTRKSKPITSAR